MTCNQLIDALNVIKQNGHGNAKVLIDAYDSIGYMLNITGIETQLKDIVYLKAE